MSVIGTTFGGIYDGDERGQLEIIQASYGLGQRSGAASGEEAVDVAFLGDIDHRADRVSEQRGVFVHA